MALESKIIILPDTESYRKEFIEHLVGSEFSIYGIPIEIIEQDFEHVFYENASGGGVKFSERRAKRMHFISSILSLETNPEIMYQTDRQTFALFCHSLECVVFLRVRKGSGKLQLGTFFDFGKDHEKMLRRKKENCVPIEREEFVNIVTGS